MSETFRVVFRTEKHGQFKGEVTAVYDEPLDRGMLGVYAHIGQHSNASLGWHRATRPATPDEYEPLLAELTRQIRIAYPDATVIVGKRLTNLFNTSVS